MLQGRGPVKWVLIGLALAVCLGALFSIPVTAKTRVEASIFLPGAAYNAPLLTSFENSVDVRFAAAKWYQDWATPFDPTPANNFHATGHLPELTWEPSVAPNSTGVSFDQVVNGSYDGYLTNFAQAVAALGYPIRISLAPEMNTNWTPWGICAGEPEEICLPGNNATNFKSFYRYVVQKFRGAGATNVSWVWSPNVIPANAASLYGNYANIYPGDTYVDYLGLDGYNWGTTHSWSSWQSFDQVFQASYQQLTGMSSKRILLMEVASTEVGGDKAAWITDMFTRLQDGYPQIQGFTWFNINKETDWRLNSSVGAQAAFTAGFNGVSATSSPTNSAPPPSTSSVPVPNDARVTGTSTAEPGAASAVVAPPATSKAVTDLVSEKYPVRSHLPPKIAGSVIASAAIARQLSPSEQGMVLAIVLAGLMALTFLTVRRSRALHALPAPLPLPMVRRLPERERAKVDSVYPYRPH